MPIPDIVPIKPRALKNPFEGSDEWRFEFKYDGFRGLLHIERGRTPFFNPPKRQDRKFTHLANAIAQAFKVESALLDGEIIAPDENGVPMFRDLMRGTQRILQFVAFDLLYLNGLDLRQMPLIERLRRLERIAPKPSEHFGVVDGIVGRGLFVFDQACKLDLEGVVAKRLDDPYDRVTKWYKIKNPTYSQKDDRGFFPKRGR
ncbi:hypothetical protein C4568_03890 [Candidatus Parcubacteria bacterium]|nr:MAG: hypothetical protein C4568_03890 [Candidatus Parcubacteria bacterium]